MNTIHPGRRLRDAMDRGVVHAPGAFNALVARAVRNAGFPARAYPATGLVNW